MSASTSGANDLVTQLSRLVTPEGDKTNVSIENFEKFCKTIFKKLTDKDTCPIKIEDNNKISINVCSNCNYVIENARGKDIRVIAKELKDRAGELRKRRDTCNDCKKLFFVFDTCYDESKAERLDKAFEELRRRLGEEEDECGNGFIKLLALLAAVYTEMIKDAKYVSKAEWFVSLLRAAASTSSSNVYLPLCPSRGDVAILLYYLAKCQIEKGSDILGGVSVKPGHVRDIVLKIAQLPLPEQQESNA